MEEVGGIAIPSLGNRRLRLPQAFTTYCNQMRDDDSDFSDNKSFTENRWPDSSDFSIGSIPSDEDERASPGSFDGHLPQPRQVSFADDFGKPLVSIKTFGESPRQSSPMRDANLFDFSFRYHSSRTTSYAVNTEEKLEPHFPDPLSNYMDLLEKLHTKNVVLESMCCRNSFMRIMVRVKDFGQNCQANIFTRVTFDGWKTSSDWKTDEFPGSSNGLRNPHDNYIVYECLVPIPPHFRSNSVVEFAVCCQCQGDFSGMTYFSHLLPKN